MEEWVFLMVSAGRGSRVFSSGSVICFGHRVSLGHDSTENRTPSSPATTQLQPLATHGGSASGSPSLFRLSNPPEIGPESRVHGLHLSRSPGISLTRSLISPSLYLSESPSSSLRSLLVYMGLSTREKTRTKK